MTPLFVRPLTVLFTLLLIAGCGLVGGDDDEGLALGTMQARVDGAGWEATNATANRVSAGGISQVTVTGATLQAEGVSFSITDTGTGTYTLDDTIDPERDALSGSYTKAVGQTYVATSGTIEIDRFDDEAVEGTFRFEARNSTGETVAVTDGTFNVGFGTSIGG